MNFDEADKTEWISGGKTPVRAGVYERRYFGDDADIEAARFDGGLWRQGRRSVDEAQNERDISGFQSHFRDAADFEWRGLKVDPNTVVIKPEVHVVAHNAPGLALDSGEFIPADELNESQIEEDLF